MSNRSGGYSCHAGPTGAQPEIHVIKLHKSTSGMGLSIVAAKVRITWLYLHMSQLYLTYTCVYMCTYVSIFLTFLLTISMLRVREIFVLANEIYTCMCTFCRALVRIGLEYI